MRFRPNVSKLLLCILCSSLLPLGALAQSSPSPKFPLDQLAWERSVKATHQDSLLAQPGVHGVGLAERGGEVVILVLVEEIGAQQLPTSLNGVNVVVETANQAHFIHGGPACWPSVCHDDELPYPVPMGVSTSSEAHYNAGTLGFKACDPVTETLGYVSANHVAAGIPWPNYLFCLNGSPGLTQFHPGLWEVNAACRFDPKCIPPDPSDYTNPVGTLNKVVDVLGPPNVNLIDAAFVASTDQETSASILDIGVPQSTPGTPTLNSCVRKSGRTTGLTYGRIDVLDLTWANTYDQCFTGDPIFDEIIAVVPDDNCGLCTGPQPCDEFAVGGDSGSALVDENDRIVGLVFAREQGNGAPVFAATIDNVLTGLGLTLDLSQCEPNQPPVAVEDWSLTLWETPVDIPFATLLANDTDPENDPLSVCGLGTPQHGTLTLSIKSGITYTPPPGCLVGLDSFTYRLCDDHGNQATGTVWVTISGIICPPSE
jgi:hypothetical protein